MPATSVRSSTPATPWRVSRSVRRARMCGSWPRARRPEDSSVCSNDEPSSMLILFAPGAPREKYFRELAAIRDTGRTLTDDEWTGFSAQHDQYSAEESSNHE